MKGRGVSVLILTLNEEVNLPGCLESVRWSDDVVVFDSFSTDRTVEIAREGGARVFQRRFDNYGAQREAARTQVDYRNEWVLALDADERPEPELVEELLRIARQGSEHAAYRLRFKVFFMGKWIKHSSLYPTWILRFFRPEKISYETRKVHEHPIVDGTIGSLENHLIHYPFSKGLEDWLARHNRYSTLEAMENLKHLREGRVDWAGLFAFRDPVRRRRALKALSFRLPFRPTLRFLYMYFLRLGVLDGLPGYTYCRLISIYEYMIVQKMKELKLREKGIPI